MTDVEHYTLDPTARVLLSDLGLSVGNILRRACLPGDTLSGGPVLLTAEQYFTLWEAIDAEADDPDLPIRIGQAISVETFQPPIFAAICSPNLITAAARIATYKALIGPLRLIITPTDQGIELELRWPPHHHPPEVLTTTEPIWWVALTRLATRTQVVPVSVTSRRPPTAAAAAADYLAVRIQPGDAVTLTFSEPDAPTSRPCSTTPGRPSHATTCAKGTFPQRRSPSSWATRNPTPSTGPSTPGRDRARTVAAHPGASNTNLGHENAGGFLNNLMHLARPAMNLITQPAAMGALPSLRAATDPDVRGNQYYGPDGFMQSRGYPVPVDRSERAKDAPTARLLWDMSEDLAGVRFDRLPIATE
jgi:hypothetical protein